MYIIWLWQINDCLSFTCVAMVTSGNDVIYWITFLLLLLTNQGRFCECTTIFREMESMVFEECTVGLPNCSNNKAACVVNSPTKAVLLDVYSLVIISYDTGDPSLIVYFVISPTLWTSMAFCSIYFYTREWSYILNGDKQIFHRKWCRSIKKFTWNQTLKLTQLCKTLIKVLGIFTQPLSVSVRGLWNQWDQNN